MGFASLGRGRLRVVLVAAIALCTLAWASGSFARPLVAANAHAVAAAKCASLTLQKGKSGVLRLKAQRGSLAIVSSRLAPGMKAKTKARTITKIGTATYRYALSKSAKRGETVRVLVGFGKGKKVIKSKTVTCAVRLAKPAVTLTVAVSGAGVGTVTSSPGTLSCTNETSPCTAGYAPGTKVRFSAQADERSEFTGWDGACSGTDACIVMATAAKTVSARFTKKQFTVTIERAGNGGGTVVSTGSALNCGTLCTGKFDAGAIIRLRADPDASSRFVGWTGECSSTATLCTFTVDGDTTITATFALKGYRLAVSRAGSGSGTITAGPGPVDCGGMCSATYDAGTVVTLTATPAAGSLFDGWFADCASSTTNTCTLTMDASHSAAASFAPGTTFSVTVFVPAVADPAVGTGTITSDHAGINCDERGASAEDNMCSGLWFPTRVVTLTATPDPGSSFDTWDNCPAMSGNSCQGTASDFASATPVAHFKTP